MSPDGRHVAASLMIEHVPTTWRRYRGTAWFEREFQERLATSAFHLIDLQTGVRKLLVDAPAGDDLWWHAGFCTRWSSDGRSLLLPSTFLPLDGIDPKQIAERESQPWTAVLRLDTGHLTGVLPVRVGKEAYWISGASFEDEQTVVLNFDRSVWQPRSPTTAVFRQKADGSWQQGPEVEDIHLAALPIKIEVRENLNQPPIIVAEDKATEKSCTIWDPNPQLKDIELGPGEVIHWKDESGFEYEAALLKPPSYVPDKRYPLVVLTNGFSINQFLPSGMWATGLSTRALAASGIVVVQANSNMTNSITSENPPKPTREGSDNVIEFDSLVKKLAAAGIVDPARVGAIGFGRSVYHILYHMTFSEHPFAAGLVSGGNDFGYFEYLADMGFEYEAEQINGGTPFGEAGLKSWLEHAPGFNIDRVKTPLLLLQVDRPSMLGNWEEYAALRHRHKPVDLILLPPPREHLSTNPANRMYFETFSVDWFRFWLQDYEDPDPAKAEQYIRWRELRKLQEANEHHSTILQAASN